MDGVATCLITGAGNGIGQAIALRFARRGERVVLVDCRGPDLHRTAELILEAGGRCDPQLVDVTSEAQVQNLGRALAGARLTSVVSCAGVSSEAMVHETSLAEWRNIIDTNLTGTFLVLREALPLLVAGGGGSIVTIGSISAQTVGAGGGCAAYESSKAGVRQLTRAIAAEYAEQGVRANCVSPGRIRTQLGEHSRELSAANGGPRTRKVPRRFAPLRNEGDPDEIAALVSFLCSDEAAFITGSDVVIDGGYSTL